MKETSDITRSMCAPCLNTTPDGKCTIKEITLLEQEARGRIGVCEDFLITDSAGRTTKVTRIFVLGKWWSMQK